MRVYKHKDQVIQVGFPVEIDGIAYPWNWFDLATEEDLNEKGFTVEEVAEPEKAYLVQKSLIISRLTDDQLAHAIGLLTVRQQERWRAPDKPAIYSNDPETIAIIRAIGADPAVVLAP